ncbi:hypothetical protein [Brucella intermedia]|uniref:hypothetical protein n=1 Tax=Brucella intermedia TaxID=94625 RepID=UPI00244AA581|nr:hypothetical protein [Brucella intermedia]WGG58370.1 hypothetical protein QA414_08405 [Brucella intermedia]
MLPNQSGYGSLAALIPDEFQIVDRLGDSVRQDGVISGVGPGRHDQAALGVI